MFFLLPVEGLEAFNSGAQQFFDGKSFLQLDETQRGDYLKLIYEGSKLTEPDQKKALQGFYRLADFASGRYPPDHQSERVERQEPRHGMGCWRFQRTDVLGRGGEAAGDRHGSAFLLV